MKSDRNDTLLASLRDANQSLPVQPGVSLRSTLSFIHNTDNSNGDGPFCGMRFAPVLEAGLICQTSMERADVRRDCRGTAGD